MPREHTKGLSHSYWKMPVLLGGKYLIEWLSLWGLCIIFIFYVPFLSITLYIFLIVPSLIFLILSCCLLVISIPSLMPLFFKYFLHSSFFSFICYWYILRYLIETQIHFLEDTLSYLRIHIYLNDNNSKNNYDDKINYGNDKMNNNDKKKQ